MKLQHKLIACLSTDRDMQIHHLACAGELPVQPILDATSFHDTSPLLLSGTAAWQRDGKGKSAEEGWVGKPSPRLDERFYRLNHKKTS